MTADFSWDETTDKKETRLVVTFAGDTDVTEAEAREAVEELVDNTEAEARDSAPRQFSRGHSGGGSA